MIRNLCVLAVAGVLFMSGCASNMALTRGQNNVDVSKMSVALASIKIANQNKPGYQPSLLYAFFFADSKEAEKTHVDLAVEPFRSEKDKYNEYLMSFYLKPGVYTFSQIWGTYKIPMLLNATCTVPINTKIEIKPNSVTYLGHVEATIVERKKDSEERAGSMVPLMDQAMAGFSSGTFNVVVKDRFQEDMKAFIAEYPGLSKVKVESNVMNKPIGSEKVAENR